MNTATAVFGADIPSLFRLDGRANARLQELAAEASTNALIVVDALTADQPIVYVNPAFERMTGYSAAQVRGTNCRFLQGKETDQAAVNQLRSAVRDGREASVLLRNYRKDGTLFWNDLKIAPVHNEPGRVTHFVGIQNDVTELKTYQARLEYASRHDALTDLINKREFAEHVASALREGGGRGLAVLHVNLRRLKRVNDSLGRDAGDRLLRTISHRLVRRFSEAGTVARLDGDEFGILLRDVSGATEARRDARMVLETIEQPIGLGHQQVFVSASIGVALSDGHLVAESLLDNADRAMNYARRMQSLAPCFFEGDVSDDILESIKLEANLRCALEAGEFELHYQRRIEISSGRVTSVEALLRWRHPQEGLISPARFIPLAEETGLIVPLGNWVLREACRQMKQWRDEGISSIRVAVNLSPRQFADPMIARTIFDILGETGLPPNQLELEITESSAMRDPEGTKRVLHKLSAAGIAIAIDDFGTGYSSLAYLKRFPIDYLKIDQSFIRGLPGDVEDQGIVRAIVALGLSLGVTLIAEGVETVDQKMFLQGLGCHEMQGFLFCYPAPGNEMQALLRQTGIVPPGSDGARRAMCGEGNSGYRVAAPGG